MSVKKKQQLGINPSTAFNRLKKDVLFKYIKLAGDDVCFQCKKKIEHVGDLSIEHKMPWLDSRRPLDLFFDLNNIAFSHLKCNAGAARNVHKGKTKHPSQSAYKKGCRCDECKEIQKEKMRALRNRR